MLTCSPEPGLGLPPGPPPSCAPMIVPSKSESSPPQPPPSSVLLRVSSEAHETDAFGRWVWRNVAHVTLPGRWHAGDLSGVIAGHVTGLEWGFSGTQSFLSLSSPIGFRATGLPQLWACGHLHTGLWLWVSPLPLPRDYPRLGWGSSHSTLVLPHCPLF